MMNHPMRPQSGRLIVPSRPNRIGRFAVPAMAMCCVPGAALVLSVWMRKRIAP
jgi:hypothetical protein